MQSCFQSTNCQLQAINVLRNCLACVRRRVRVFCVSTAAATAIEFALLSPLFIAPLLAALEIGVVYFAKSELDEAANEVSRAVMTGQATTSGQVSSAFCNAVGGLIDCHSVMVNLASYNALGAMQTGNPTITFNPDGTVSNAWSENFGASGSIMVMQAVYQFPVIGGGMLSFTGQSNGMLPLVSTTVFVRE